MRNDLSSDGASIDTMSFVDLGTAPALSVQIQPEHNVVGTESTMRTSRVCVTLTAKDLPDDDDTRAPVDILVVLDDSGSMAGAKLKLCQQTLDLLLRTLSARDRFGLITYNSSARLVIAPQNMTPENKAAAVQQVKSLRASGGTNLSAAIGLAFQEMNNIETPNEVRSIFLLTDGLANQGISDTPGLVELTKNCLDSQEPLRTIGRDPPGSSWQYVPADSSHPEVASCGNTIPTQVQTSDVHQRAPTSMYTFGYGTGHNANLLKELAEAASGGYYFVDGDSNVAAAFGDALGGILSIVAQNVVVTLQMAIEAAATGASIVKVHHDQALKRENGSYTVNVGDIYAEESRDVVATIQLALPTVHLLTPIPHVIAFVGYTDTLQKRPAVTSPLVCSIARPSGNGLSDVNTHVALQVFRVLTTETMTQANQLAQRGELAKAKAELGNIDQRWMQQTAAVQSDGRAKELYQDVKDLASGLQSRNDYTARSSKHFSSHMMKHTMQRGSMSAAAAPAAPGCIMPPAAMAFGSAYRNTKMAKMSNFFAAATQGVTAAARPATVPEQDTKPPADSPPQAKKVSLQTLEAKYKAWGEGTWTCGSCSSSNSNQNASCSSCSTLRK